MFQVTSQNLKQLSEVLKKDEKFENPESIENQRRIIQNNFDDVFYRAYPLLYQQFENMVIFGLGNLY